VTAGIKANVDGSAAIQVGGVDAITLTSAGAASFVTSPMTIQGGSASAPSLTFSGDTNTGIFSPAADTIAISTGGTERVRVNGSGTITYTRTTLASYLWSIWNPTNITGTVTTAPSTGTTDDSDYVTLANSSGTVTVTFDVAGTYIVNLQASTFHSNVYAYDTFYFNLGGTATRRTDRAFIDIWGDSVNDGNLFSGFPLFVTATASQTLTVQPQYRVSGSGTTSNHNAAAAMTVQYCGG
jgi:hypothetical protein